jgi:hypothetical protein
MAFLVRQPRLALVVPVLGLVLAAGCSRKPPAPEPAAVAPAATPAAELPSTATRTGALVAPVPIRRTESVATNTPTPACATCPAEPAPRKNLAKLDEQLIAQVKESIDATCDLLEQGVTILEKNQGKPDAALTALQAFHKKSAATITRSLEQAKQVRERLASLGYTQDIPEAVKAHYEARMTKISTRLEPLQTIYRDRKDVLQAFGMLFPRQ